MSVNQDQVLDDAENLEGAEQESNAGGAEHQEQQIDYDAEAKEMGWNPEYSGPHKKTAQEFVEDGYKILPIVNANLKKEREKVSTLEARLNETEASNRKSIEALQKHFERETERHIAEIQTKKKQAVKN